MIYHTFAQLYDQLFDDELYRKWAAYTQANGGSSAQQVLDLAGGAGRLAVLLAQWGQAVTVADFSADMLSLASQHAAAAGVELTLVEADMRDLTALPQYDLVTCFADSLCYLADIEDAETTFQQVAAHLRTGGRFLFDMITPYQTDVVYPGYMYNYEDDDHQRAFLWQSYGDDDVPHGVIHELAFFNRLADGHYERIGETHFERSYPLATITAALKRSGFTDIAVTADFGRAAPDEQTTRWFFSCQR
ncbi:MAG TPA: class I SAM-dependent methyltransferase [Candidatus Limosilactobacillus intestinigallinarum]|nr:class I SAM-dependent methyltransferase [Candidatus Limosilactobacillus intestinigallinarum]